MPDTRSASNGTGPDARETAGVRIPPPIIFALALLSGAALDRLAPIAAPLPAWRLAALALSAAGGALDLWAIGWFGRARTTILPWGRASALVAAGPYRFTRNPMYVGLALLYVGLAIAIGSWWALLLLPIVLATVTLYVIRREERHLEARFGEDYRAYKARVRRWL